MESFTLELENARALQGLFGSDERLLKELETQFQVQVTTRDAWLRVEGEAAQVALARHVLEQLEAARKLGLVIRRHEFLYVLQAVMEGREFQLSQLLETKIQCGRNRPPVIPRTEGQKAYVHAIRHHDITFGLGPAGTGKTYLAVALAVESLKQDKVKRIVLTRPAVEAGEALGFLPGDLTEKILPYLRPLYDALHDMLEPEETQKYLDRGIIEIAPLAYMRGRTLGGSFVILDEAQNTTTEQMFMFLTRLGADSKAVVTGDATQIDLPKHKRSGLVEAADALRSVPGIAFHQFQERDVVRHPLVQAIIRAYQSHRGLQAGRI
jgi:phosphate starvation-inducible PhoH-like protein